ncbi:hypothetical protein TEA_016247 [Camellia sinensis var. sinensis]|uniref:F-box domain-containing protein n=1 Tax=Camellia sinensis var. sinensis TaxID=542762 RepID=A0A4S4ETK1_CAMSN|nr:hypothetical protein TEA_016247 [Camellia sinensis var. sinensis]
MEGCGDFLQWLGPDTSMNILMCLKDPSDLIRVCSVSSSWRRFGHQNHRPFYSDHSIPFQNGCFDGMSIPFQPSFYSEPNTTSLYITMIENSLSKQLCLRLFPEISSFAHVIEVENTIEPIVVKPDKSMEWEYLKRDHRVYAFLARGLTSFVRKDCLSEAIFASSTDNYPEESIQNTLEPSDRVEQRASYWSSEGESDPTVPEILDYKLISKLCVITEIHVQPFQARAVRFRMGRPRSSMEIGSDFRDEFEAGRESPDYAFEWTYTSPEFPMAQENCLQKFKLPEPVLCIGGILQVELLGRAYCQEELKTVKAIGCKLVSHMKEKTIMSISHVQVVGRPLSSGFDVDIHGPSGRCTLKYYHGAEHCQSPTRAPEG